MSDSIEVKTTVRFKRWQAPNFARVDMSTESVIAVDDLDAAALKLLAAAWLDDLYGKTVYNNPFCVVGVSP